MKLINLDKNTDPSLTILYISSLILKTLKKNDLIPYSDLRNYVIKNSSEKAEFLFPYAISFLYTINKLEYISNLDSFRMVK